MKITDDMKALHIVVNAGFADDIIDIAREAGVKGATILNARGKSGTQNCFMGIQVDDEKELIICIADESTTDKAMEIIQEKAGIETPAHSVCFTMSIDKMIGGRWLASEESV